MAKNKNNKRRPKKGSAIQKESLSALMQAHLKGIGMSTVEDYFDWCRQHGFTCKLNKQQRQIDEEDRNFKDNQAASAMRKMRSQRRPDRALKRLLRDRDSISSRALEPIHALLHNNSIPQAQRDFAKRLLTHLDAICPQMIWERTGRGGTTDGVYLEALMTLAEHHSSLCRSIEKWKPSSHNAVRRFRSLVHHLFADFAPPEFLEQAWLDKGPHGRRHRGWYLHLASGKSMRDLELPIDYTKKMRHYFLTAPGEYSVIEALRWGQVLGLGGDAHLASALRETQLCRSFDNESFWITVIRFFIEHPMLDRQWVAPIIDYINNQRFVSGEHINAEGRAARTPPPQPNLSMRGRGPDSLLRQVQEWHGELHRDLGARNYTWKRSLIPAYRSVEGKVGSNSQRIWTITELFTSSLLSHEGRVMRHCVATYALSCRRGRCSIWTLELESKTGKSKQLTLEVNSHTMQIVQARARMNARPTEQARGVLTKWAAGAGLSIADWV